MQTNQINLSGKRYTIFEVTVFKGTPRQQQIPVAEHSLDKLINELIEKGEYTKEVANIDTLYAYALTKDVNTNSEEEIRLYVEKLLDGDLNPLD